MPSTSGGQDKRIDAVAPGRMHSLTPVVELRLIEG